MMHFSKIIWKNPMSFCSANWGICHFVFKMWIAVCGILDIIMTQFEILDFMITTRKRFTSAWLLTFCTFHYNVHVLAMMCSESQRGTLSCIIMIMNISHECSLRRLFEKTLPLLTHSWTTRGQPAVIVSGFYDGYKVQTICFMNDY